MRDFNEPLYSSKGTWRSLWRQYRIYGDRLELPSFLGTKVIPLTDILDIEVRPPLVIGDVFRGKAMGYCWALKLDMADFCRHIALHRKSGLMKRLRFSPHDPNEFVRECRGVRVPKEMR